MASNNAAKTLKELHVPSQPLIIPNVWDISSLNALISLNSEESRPVKAVATASYAIAATLGIPDEQLTYDQNLEAIARLAPVAAKAGLPLSTDLQDGYGSRIAEAVTAAIKAGAVGANIEDTHPETGAFYGIEEQVGRLKVALKAAADAGCPDFVLNARCDAFYPPSSAYLPQDSLMDEAVARGKAYLEAGATTVFFWGGSGRGLRDAEVSTLVQKLGGRVAVKASMKPDALSTAELAEKGVARISVGPSLHAIAMQAVKKAASELLAGGKLT
ncbi:unnamed protein product [Clonostachys byssicola]|uniref:Carboxyphosphonoenolpyruvate phosphonomutase-like protein n=1 Tax=Clonostachys byssicola TaxID=160290 RepID=A0A9N9UG48_9HYPO|nr:unnamed protein product [Clonostachys byssicola]